MTDNTLQQLRKLDMIEDELTRRDISARQDIKRSFVALESTKPPRQLLVEAIATNHKILQALTEYDFTYPLSLTCSACGEPSVVFVREAGQIRVECTHCNKKYLEV